MTDDDASSDASVQHLVSVARLAMARGDVGRALDLYRAIAAIAPGDADAAGAIQRLEAAIQTAASRLATMMGPFAIEHRFPAPYIGFTGRPLAAHADGNRLTGERLDAWGFPNRALPDRNKPNDELRIFVIGDSTMFNGPNLAGTVPSLLEAHLRETGLPRARVYNFSIVSASATQMTLLLLLRLGAYAPDLVIVCSGAVDLIAARDFDPRPGYPYNFFLLEQLHLHFFGPDAVPALDRDQLFTRAAAYQIQLRAETGWPGPEWEAEVVDAYLASVATLERVTDAHALDTILVLEPMVATRKRPTDEEIAYLKPETFAYYERQYARLRAGLFGAPQPRRRLTVHDGSIAFADADGAVFRDYIHFNPEGTRLMVAFLARLVRERLGVA